MSYRRKFGRRMSRQERVRDDLLSHLHASAQVTRTPEGVYHAQVSDRPDVAVRQEADARFFRDNPKVAGFLRPLEQGDLPDGMPMPLGRWSVLVLNLGDGDRARVFYEEKDAGDKGAGERDAAPPTGRTPYPH